MREPDATPSSTEDSGVICLVRASLSSANPDLLLTYSSDLLVLTQHFGGISLGLYALEGEMALAGLGAEHNAASLFGLLSFANSAIRERFEERRLAVCPAWAREEFCQVRPLFRTGTAPAGQLRIPYHLLRYH